jgi:hypothetical protein
LTLFPDPLLAKIWEDELKLVPMMNVAHATATAGDIQMAARRLDIFLDCIAREAADVSTFLLDPTYEQLLDDDDELQLRDQLVAALATAEAIGGRSSIAAQVLRLLSPLQSDSR